MAEETGVRVTAREKFMDVKKRYQDKLIWLHFYFCEYLSGEPRPIECQRTLWIDVSRLRDFEFPPSNNAVIRGLEKLFESRGHEK